ncbi:MAG: hypothetical protein ACI9SJ_002330 [Flavobacteriaceae bacterium]|jgi:hypothetical protein
MIIVIDVNTFIFLHYLRVKCYNGRINKRINDYDRKRAIY